MNVLTISNQKGGVGKTTTAVTIAGLLALAGKRVLLVDLDPQCSLSHYFGFDPDSVDASLYDLFFSENEVTLQGIARATETDGLDVVSASPAMATLDRQLGTRQGQGLVLKRAVQAMDQQYDWVLLDCPPTLGMLMINALAACNAVVLPTQTEHLALKGLERMLRTLEMVNRSRGVPLEYLIVPTMFDQRTRASHQALEHLTSRYADQLSETVIPVDTMFREASRRGIPLPQLNPQARGVKAFQALLKEIERRGLGVPAPMAETA